MWVKFLQQAEQFPRHLCRPFVDFSENPQYHNLDFYSDAAKSGKLGMGAIYRNNWIVAKWGNEFIQNMDPSIEYLELFALTAAVITWSDLSELRNMRIIIYCDNQAVVHMVNTMASNCYQCRKLIHILALDGMKKNRHILVKYVRSSDNTLSDALSRLDFKHFWKYAPKDMNRTPSKIDSRLLPPESLWVNDQHYLSLF